MAVFVVGSARVQESVDLLFVFKIPTVTALSCKKIGTCNSYWDVRKYFVLSTVKF